MDASDFVVKAEREIYLSKFICLKLFMQIDSPYSNQLH